MYFIIEKKIKENPNIISKSLNLSTQNFSNSKEDLYNTKDINNIQNYEKTNVNFEILNQRILKTPLLVNKINLIESNPSINKKEKLKHNLKKNQIKNKCFNILYQSNSELNNSPDLNNKNFLMNFLYFINHISFPLKYYDINQSFLINISSEEKEYKFIKAFISNFNVKNFTLEKWYCHEYYNQVFNHYSSIEFLFENNLLLFYSYYNEIIDNFFHDIYQIKECFLMIEENPNNLINQNSDNKIVMYALIQKKFFENNNIDSIVYNKNDDKFYFKNPFDWIGHSDSIDSFKNSNFIISKKNNPNNILVPIYIINISNF